jgi:hypothetical protein
MANFEEIYEDEGNVFPLEALSQADDTNPPSDPIEVGPLISLHALTDLSYPQSLKLIGYIKHQKVIILINNGTTHNFIHCQIYQEKLFYIHAFNNFQLMIANGDSMKCGCHCENVHLQIGDYNMRIQNVFD